MNILVSHMNFIIIMLNNNIGLKKNEAIQLVTDKSL